MLTDAPAARVVFSVKSPRRIASLELAVGRGVDLVVPPLVTLALPWLASVQEILTGWSVSPFAGLTMLLTTRSGATTIVIT